MRENNQAAGKTWTYAYDDGGNIRSKTKYAYTTGTLGAAVRTVAYGYGDAGWSDLLTSIGGQSLTADEIGNLLSDGTWAYTWQHGRQLAGMNKTGTNIAYGYDSDGKRITKIVNGTAYNYHYLGDQLVELTWGGNKLHFTYDSTGPLSVNCNGTEYFYVKNAQGDVTGLVSASGTRVVTYTYDAWGNPLSTTGSLATTLGEQNPLRYRGYVYDTETGLYYLQSRYYNPTWGRFINADAELAAIGESAQGQNLFVYCNNAPVNMVDPDGSWPKWVTGAINIVSGTLQMMAGAALGAAAGWTGIGAAAAGFLILNGAATATQGVGQIVNSVTGSNILREDNIIRTGAQMVGNAIGGKRGQEIAGIAYDAVTIAANLYAGQALNSPSQCFVAGTVVLTMVGDRAIETVQAGDMVWAENPETGEKELKAVVRTFVNEASELMHISVNGEEIVTTLEHPFYSPVKGWTVACKLRAGDILVLQSGKYVIVEKVQHEILESPIAVYNFEVADFHTYYVGKSAVLVHNVCGARNTADQDAVIKLANEFKHGLKRDDAITLANWAKEYGISYHYPAVHTGRSGIWSRTEHIKIFNAHIPIVK